SSPAAADLGRVAAPATLLCTSTAAAIDLVGPAPLIARTLIRLLSPGPAVFRVQMPEAALAAARAAVSAPPGVVDTGEALLLRVPGPSLSATLAARLESTFCLWEPLDAQGRSILDVNEALTAAS